MLLVAMVLRKDLFVTLLIGEVVGVAFVGAVADSDAVCVVLCEDLLLLSLVAGLTHAIVSGRRDVRLVSSGVGCISASVIASIGVELREGFLVSSGHSLQAFVGRKLHVLVVSHGICGIAANVTIGIAAISAFREDLLVIGLCSFHGLVSGRLDIQVVYSGVSGIATIGLLFCEDFPVSGLCSFQGLIIGGLDGKFVFRVVSNIGSGDNSGVVVVSGSVGVVLRDVCLVGGRCLLHALVGGKPIVGCLDLRLGQFVRQDTLERAILKRLAKGPARLFADAVGGRCILDAHVGGKPSIGGLGLRLGQLVRQDMLESAILERLTEGQARLLADAVEGPIDLQRVGFQAWCLGYRAGDLAQDGVEVAVRERVLQAGPHA